MKVWTDKEGKAVSGKEFMTRWKQGIEKVSSLDKVKMQILFTYIVLLGIIIGIISVIYGKMWWLLVVLIGSFGLTIVSLIGIYQQYYAYKNIEDILAKANSQVFDGPVDASKPVEVNNEIKQ